MSLYVIYGFDTASTLAEETRNPRAEAPKAVLASVIGAFVIGAIFLWGILVAVPDMGEAVASFATGPQQVIEGVLSSALATPVPARRRRGDLRVLHVDPHLDDPAGVRDGARRPAPVLEADGQGEPEAAHAGVGVRDRRRARRDPLHPVRRRRRHRGRRDRVDLPELPARQPRGGAGAVEGMAADEGAVLARPVGDGRERRRDRLGRSRCC